MRSRRTAYGTSSMHGWQRQGVHGLGAGAVAVTSAGAAPTTFAVAGARSPMELGNVLLAKEGASFRAETSDKPCTSLWTCLLYDVPCDQALSLVFNDVYVEAQHAMAALAAVEPSPDQRALYTGLVGAYGWVMTWAAGVANVCLPLTGAGAVNLYDPSGIGHDAYTRTSAPSRTPDGRTRPPQTYTIFTSTSAGLGMARSRGAHPDGTGDLPITLSQLNVNRCNPGVWAGHLDDGSGTTVASARTFIGVDESWLSATGAARAASARAVAQSLANYSVIDLLADAWARYIVQANAWSAAGTDIGVSANVAGQESLKQQAARAWGGVEAAAASIAATGQVLHLIPGIGTLAAIITAAVGGVLEAFTKLPTASGGVTCPWPFLYRSSSSPDCSGSSTTPGGIQHTLDVQQGRMTALVQAQAAAKAAIYAQAQAGQAAPSKAPLIIGGAVVGGLGLLVLLLRKVKR